VIPNIICRKALCFGKGPFKLVGLSISVNESQGKTMASKIEDYGLIGNTHTAALVSRSGSTAGVQDETLFCIHTP